MALLALETLQDVPDDKVVQTLIDAETTGMTNAKLQRAALGDAGLVYDPSDPSLTQAERRKRATEALRIHEQSLAIANGATGSGVAHDLANAVSGGHGTMNPLVMGENKRKAVSAWMAEHEGALEAGDPEAWAELQRQSATQEAINGAADQVKTETAKRAKEGIAEVAGGFLPAAGPVGKVLIGLASAAAIGGSDVAIQGGAADQEKIAADAVKRVAASLVEHAIPGDYHKIFVNTAIDVGADPATLRSGQGLEVFAEKLIGAIFRQGLDEEIAGRVGAVVPGTSERDARTRDAAGATIGGAVDLLPKLLDGTLSAGDLVGLGLGTSKKIGMSSAGRSDASGKSAAGLAADLAKHDPKKGPLTLTDEQLRDFLAAGIDPRELETRGISKDRLDKAHIPGAREQVIADVLEGRKPADYVPPEWIAASAARFRPNLTGPTPEDLVLRSARRGQEAVADQQRALGMTDDPFAPEELAGFGGVGARAAASSLADGGVRSGYVDGQALGCAGHGFAVAAPAGSKPSVIDPAFGQFLAQEGPTGDRARAFVVEHPVLAQRLLTTGALELDDATARAYHRVLTGKDDPEITAAWFANQAR